MKKISISFYPTLMIVIALFLSTTASTQPSQRQQGPPPLPSEKEITQIVDDLAVEISLSKVQKTQISELYFAHFDDVKELTGQRGRSQESQEAMEKLRADFDHEVKEFLTEEQQKLFDEYQEKNKPQRRREGRQRGGGR
jgi:Spy/CpxP family protein refolding chaperone